MDNAKAEKSIQGLTFFPVPDFSAPECAFGADESKYFDRRKLPYVPAKYVDMAASFFYDGGQLPPFGKTIDKQKAHKALRAWLCSFAPPHESKMATVGYALWLWTTID